MHSQYIEYLKSMNNASSANENAIAESQITNPFYEKIRVEREIGNRLIEVMSQKATVIILTGHAGDGKTSLLHQILRKLNVIPEGEKLKVSDICQPKTWNNKLFYVKDMSELTIDEQVGYLKYAFEMKENNSSSILVSNTGPIIDVFKEMHYRLNNDVDNVEMDLLKLLDKNNGEPGKVGNDEVLIVNLAKIDNTDIIPQILEKILNPELWGLENNCFKVKKCPVVNNYITLKNNEEYIKKFIQAFYRWLYENDQRLTIRQILAHLTFAITGNLDCKVNDSNRLIFDYHFSNLFFGYVGFNKHPEADKIRAINEIQKLNMDEKNLIFDYELFVKESFDSLNEHVRDMTLSVWNSEMKQKIWSTDSLLNNEYPFLVRKAIRRIQILFSNFNDEQYNELLGQLFSPIYPLYLHIRENKLEQKELRQLKPKFIKALKTMLIGSAPSIHDSGPLYLPLKQSGISNQNVFLLIGQVEISDINITQEKVNVLFSNESYFQLVIRFKRINEYPFEITLLLLDYFEQLEKGSLSTKLSPSLSHGVDKMKSKLFNHYRFDEDDPMKLLIRTLHGVKIVDFEVVDDLSEIYFE